MPRRLEGTGNVETIKFMTQKKRIAIVYGGYQSERAVSERSMQGLLGMLGTERYEVVPVEISRAEWLAHVDGRSLPIDRRDFGYVLDGRKLTFDACYITIHGAPGENGQLPAYLEMIGVRHTTCPWLVGGATYDKWVCNQLLRAEGLPVAASYVVRPGDVPGEPRLPLPCFVKPTAAGSSFGVSKVKSPEQYAQAIEAARQESPDVMVEAFIPGREFTVGLYRTRGELHVLPITEVRTANEFFDYDAKYNGKTTEVTPAEVSESVAAELRATAQRVYQAFAMRGLARVDFRVTPEGKVYVLEVNTTPGLTTTSFIPQQIRAAGLDPADVFADIIEEALHG